MSRFSHLLLIVVGGILVASGLLWQNSTRLEKEVAGITSVAVPESTVESVIDGDTFILGSGEKIRLIGINAPEKAQPYADKAKEKLEDLIKGKEVKIATDIEEKDEYGRTLGYISTGNVNINLEMIKSGFAVVETVPPNVSQQDSFVVAQKEAREKCAGIWEGLCSSSESVCIQISEIHAKSTVTSKNGEWIELINTCTTPQDLSGYLIKDSSASSNYVFGKVELNPKKTIKLYSGCGEDSAAGIYWQCPERGSFIWNDNGDRAYLYNNSGKLISELGY